MRRLVVVSAVIVTLVLLGQVLELRAHSQTSGAIRALPLLTMLLEQFAAAGPVGRDAHGTRLPGTGLRDGAHRSFSSTVTAARRRAPGR